MKRFPIALALAVGVLGVAAAFVLSIGGPGAIAAMLTRVFGRLFG